MADHPQVHQRRRERHWALQRLGFKDYPSYLRSPHWAKIRAAYWVAAERGDLPRTCFCGATDGLQLHHVTYERVGCERLSDLIPLCATCHRDVHVLNRRGDLPLTLQGLENPWRAYIYRVQGIERDQRARDEAPPALEERVVTTRKERWKRKRERRRQVKAS